MEKADAKTSELDSLVNLLELWRKVDNLFDLAELWRISTAFCLSSVVEKVDENNVKVKECKNHG